MHSGPKMGKILNKVFVQYAQIVAQLTKSLESSRFLEKKYHKMLTFLDFLVQLLYSLNCIIAIIF